MLMRMLNRYAAVGKYEAKYRCENCGKKFFRYILKGHPLPLVMECPKCRMQMARPDTKPR